MKTLCDNPTELELKDAMTELETLGRSVPHSVKVKGLGAIAENVRQQFEAAGEEERVADLEAATLQPAELAAEKQDADAELAAIDARADEAPEGELTAAEVVTAAAEGDMQAAAEIARAAVDSGEGLEAKLAAIDAEAALATEQGRRLDAWSDATHAIERVRRILDSVSGYILSHPPADPFTESPSETSSPPSEG